MACDGEDVDPAQLCARNPVEFQRSLERMGLVVQNDGSIATKENVSPPNLPQAVQEMKATLATRKGKHEPNDAMSILIKKCVKEQLWRILKFVKGPKSQQKAAEKVLELLAMEEFRGDSAEMKQRRLEWVIAYGPTVTKEINSLRSYVQTRIKDSCIKFASRRKGEFPKVEELVECLTRNNPKYDVGIWYWDELVPIATGNTVDWNSAKRHTLKMRNAAPPNNPKKLYVPPSTEAIIVAMLESNTPKWEELVKVQEKYPGKKIVPMAKINPDKPSICELAPNKIALNDRKYLAKYTDVEMGQQKYSGWTKEGLEAYEKYRDMCIEGRNSTNAEFKEACILTEVRKKHGLPGSVEAEKAQKRRKLAHEIEDDDENQDIFMGEE